MAYRLSRTSAPLCTRVPIEQARSLQRLAARRGLTVSDVVSVLIDREFSDEQPTPTQLTHHTTTNDDEPLAA